MTNYLQTIRYYIEYEKALLPEERFELIEAFEALQRDIELIEQRLARLEGIDQ